MIDKIKKAFRFGDPTNAEYLKEIEQLRMQQEAQIAYQKAEEQRYRQMMNTAQNAIQRSPYQQQERYSQGWNDPRGVTRGLMNAASMTSEEALVRSLGDTNQAMKRLADRLEKQERRLDMLSGFYTWITEVHPEIAAQHKAMRDLYEAANAPQEKEMAS